jgi:hypothetical protein
MIGLKAKLFIRLFNTMKKTCVNKIANKDKKDTSFTKLKYIKT